MTDSIPPPRSIPAWIKVLDDVRLPALAGSHARVRHALGDSSRSLREIADLIALRPAADLFLGALRQAGKHVALITNAHRDSLSLKLERIELAPWFDRMISSHDYGFPKEDQQFWFALRQDFPFDPSRTLFIDDSLAVLRSAARFGVAHLLAVREPDSRGGPRDTEEFAAVEDYLALVRNLAGLVN